MFNRLFRPKWEHANPRIRCEALESADAPPEALAKAAREDVDSSVRCCAAKRLEDIALLTRLIGADSETTVREAAEQRRRELLARPLAEGPPLEQRLGVIRDAGSADLGSFLARQAQAVEIRSAVLDQLEDSEILCAVAVDDPVAALRRQALDLIDDPQGWETVAQGAKKKDKQISRLARERLDAYRQRQLDEETAAGLCGELESLAGAEPKSGSRAVFLALVSRWERLQSPLPPELTGRFSRSREIAEERIQRREALVSERRALCDGLKTLLQRLQPGAANDTGAMDAIGEELEKIIERWQVLPAEGEDRLDLTTGFNQSVTQVRAELQRWTQDEARAVRLRGLLDKAQALIDKPDEVSEKRIEGLQDQWSGLPQPESRQSAEDLQQQFKTLMKALRERLKQQVDRRLRALEEASTLISELEKALQEGALKQALSLRDRARHRLKTAKGVADRKRAALQDRLHRTHPRIEYLTKWRHWGDSDAREHLCGDIERLADSALSPSEIAARVRNARESWKRIDRAEGPAAEDLWHRFDQACTQAYAPFQEEQHQQAELRQAHLVQKQALCHELEAFEGGVDWDNVDWREVDKKVRKARERWRRIGSVPRKESKALERDFRRTMDRLEEHLGGERERELTRRQALVARMEELANASDLHAASREVKEAQRNWKPSVQARRRVEQELWQKFHTACDAIFQRLRDERDAADAELQANLERKTALCQELAGLLDKGELAYADLAKRFAKAAGEWSEVGPLPRNKGRDLEARFKQLKDRLQELRQQESRAAAAAQVTGMRQRASLCARLEMAALEGSQAEDERRALLQESRQQWQQLAPIDSSQLQPLEQRFERAEQALQGDDEARQALLRELPENLNRGLDLCLRMEVEAGIESPEEFAQARMQFQVSRLSDAFHHRLEEARSGEDRLHGMQQEWFLIGLAPKEAREMLERRFQRVMDALAAEAEAAGSTPAAETRG